MTSRVRLLDRDDAPIGARPYHRASGRASALIRSLSNAPDVMETLMPFLGQIMDESSIDLATKELVILRVSQLNGCAYCLAAHRPLALAAGLSEKTVAIVCSSDATTLTPRERAVLLWVDKVTLDPHAVTDELTAAMLDHVRDDQLIELTLLAGAISMLNAYCAGLDIPPPETADD